LYGVYIKTASAIQKHCNNYKSTAIQKDEKLSKKIRDGIVRKILKAKERESFGKER